MSDVYVLWANINQAFVLIAIRKILVQAQSYLLYVVEHLGILNV